MNSPHVAENAMMPMASVSSFTHKLVFMSNELNHRPTLGQHAVPQIEFRPTRWLILDVWYPSENRIAGGICVEEKRTTAGTFEYAVCLRNRWVLSKEGTWDKEPVPLLQNTVFLASHRWTELKEAVAAALDAASRIQASSTHDDSGDSGPINR